jgi:NAD(P)-dependent dehydrogenase (short-subunit alcohol dehydrogenase family)
VGYEVARQLLAKGHEVILACRDTQKATAAAGTLRSHQHQHQQQQQQPPASSSSSSSIFTLHCDLSSFESVRRCAAEISQTYPQLDILVCNAAVIPNSPRSTSDGSEEAVQVNHLSHFLLVDLLLPSLVKAADARAAAAAAAAPGDSSSSSSSSRVVVVGSKQHAQVPAGFDDATKLESVMKGEEVLPPMQL